MNYALTGIKLARGEETPCFSANVTLDGVVIGSVRNSGTGGSCMWHWNAPVCAAVFDAWIKANTTETFEPEDDWAYAQLDKFEEMKSLMRHSLKKAQFRIDGDEEGAYRTIGKPDCAEVRAYILAKYAAQHPVIFNRNTKTWDALTVAKVAA